MDDLNKHYVRIDTNGCVIYAFSDAFEQPREGDIFVEEGGRHFNPQLFDMDGIALYKWDGRAMVLRTDAEKAPEIATKAKEKQRQAILNRLAELDKEVPRVVEDIIQQGKFTLYPSKQAIISEKTALREQLKTL